MMQKNEMILKLRAALDLSHVPSQPMSIPSPRGMIGHVFEGLLAREFKEFGIVFLQFEAN